jgi:hypothetical protein
VYLEGPTSYLLSDRGMSQYSGLSDLDMMTAFVSSWQLFYLRVEYCASRHVTLTLIGRLYLLHEAVKCDVPCDVM